MIVPILGILTEMIRIEKVIVGAIALIAFLGGILRMVYALIFETSEPETLEQKALKYYRKVFKKQQNLDALPPQQSIPVSDYSNNRQECGAKLRI